MRLTHKTLTALAIALPLLVFAQASATREDACNTGAEGGCSLSVSTVTVKINVPLGDAGKPGAFFIGARATTGIPGDITNINNNTQGLWLFTPGGWVAFNGSAYTPIESFARMPSSQQYVVVEQQNLCQLVRDNNMELWAGYGVLQPETEQAIDTYLTVKAPRIPPEHLRAVYVYNDMKDAKKYWNVLNMPACYRPDTGNNNGGN